MNVSTLPASDANFLSRALELFDASESVIEDVDGSILDKSALIAQARCRLHKNGAAWKGVEIVAIDAALSFYLQTVADREGKAAVAKRLMLAIENAISPLL